VSPWGTKRDGTGGVSGLLFIFSKFVNIIIHLNIHYI
jgi:hypothetical protein